METVKKIIGLGPKVRYGIVGLGDIAQRVLMPAVAHTKNSEIVALVTGDPKKADEVAKQYKVDKKNTYSYEEYDKMLKDKVVDAVYIATPNFRHAEFAIPALKAGVHVLLEKPMELDTEKCEKILEAQKGSTAKLMIAYRLHFEPATIAVVDRVRKGEFGEVTMFSSVFTQMVDPKNHRAQHGWEAGPLYDIGIYCLNAARKIFGEEPIEVSAVAYKPPESDLQLDDTIAVTLTFPKNRVGQFIVSYYGSPIDQYTIIGTKGSITVNPAFMFTSGLEFNPVVVGEKRKHEEFKHTDQFAGELEYFSECILENKTPEPDGREGLADVRVLQACVASLKSKKPQKLDKFDPPKPLLSSQEKTIGGHKLPSQSELVNAKPPTR